MYDIKVIETPTDTHPDAVTVCSTKLGIYKKFKNTVCAKSYIDTHTTISKLSNRVERLLRSYIVHDKDPFLDT